MFWDALGCFARFCGTLWEVRGCSVAFRDVLRHFGVRWGVLCCFVTPYWCVLVFRCLL